MMTETNKICRFYNFEIRSAETEEKGAELNGIPIVFDQVTNLGPFDEIIDRGALDTTDLKDVRLLINHNTSMVPLARSRNNNENSTMQLSVEEDGLHFRANIDVDNNTDAKNIYSAIKRGDVSGMSFMFTVDGEEWEDLESEHPTRHIRNIGKVFEVSAVTFPAYEQTSINARSAEALESAKAALESAKAEERQNELKEAIKKKLEEMRNDG